jgi:hypothetical protein
VKHEDYLLPLANWSVDFEIEGTLNDGGYVSAFEFNGSGGYNYSLCLSPFGVSAMMTAYIKYTTSPGYTHRYFLVRENLTNVTKYITLYNFNDTDLDSLELTLRRASTYAYYPNLYVKWQRYYVSEALWRTVQMDKSGDFGLTVFHIYEQTTDYRFLVLDESGRVLKTSDTLKFVCDTNDVCQVETLLNPYEVTEAVTDISYGVAYNNDTGMITASWVDNLGNVASVRWVVEQQTMKGAGVLCNATQTGAGGTLSCNVSGYEGTVAVRLYRTASPEKPFYSVFITLVKQSLGKLIGQRNGAFIVGAMLITAAGFGVASPVIGIVVTVFVLFVGAGLGLMSALTYVLVVTTEIMGIVVGFLVRR